ncbi:aldehyde dehydrogenase family protein [Herbiconiux ginsengi]|uniref:aldehyde dehydrogenase family protein n=1 Tax=Herbiconiux ginsengi TaxID=381665 RepID=UPI001FDF39A1|nr:aldehyde dehydrogenase family protein [Herbiconiux ginsengi]
MVVLPHVLAFHQSAAPAARAQLGMRDFDIDAVVDQVRITPIRILSRSPQKMCAESHWINESESLSASGRTSPVFDPALGVVTKEVALAKAEEISATIVSAKMAYPAWRNLSLTRRQAIPF